LRRIEVLYPQLNIFITVTAEEALAAARVPDEKLSEGENDSPLLGIPISIKDLELTRGIRTTPMDPPAPPWPEVPGRT